MNPWGPLSAEEVVAVKEAPAMKAAEIIRKYDPAWGLTGKKVFKVSIIKEVRVTEEAIMIVAADTVENAKKIVQGDKKNWHNLDFKEVGEDSDIYIENTVEVK